MNPTNQSMEAAESNILVARQYLDCRADLAREQAKVKLLRRAIQEEVVTQSFNSALMIVLGGLMKEKAEKFDVDLGGVDLVDKMSFLEGLMERLNKVLQDTD